MQNEKIKVQSVTVTRAEGPSYLCDKPQTFDLISKANSQLNIWSFTAPKGGAYDKCDFEIVFDDGMVYRGRYDLHNGEVADIGRHVRSFARYVIECPYSSEQDKADFKEFLETYDI